jgi:small basic protein
MKRDSIVVALMLVAGAGIAAVLVYVGHEVGLREHAAGIWNLGAGLLGAAPAVWVREALTRVAS